MADWPSQLDFGDCTILANVSGTELQKSNTDECLGRFNSFSKFIRVVATSLRWLPFNRKFKGSPLQAEELNSARLKVLQFDQSVHFAREVRDIAYNKPILKCSKIRRLRPFRDEHGLLRVGSRMEEYPYVTFDEKYPIILDKRSKLSHMIAWDFHRILLHAGTNLILSAISRKYDILCGK